VTEEETKRGWFATLETRHDAIKTATNVGDGFYVIAGIMAGMAVINTAYFMPGEMSWRLEPSNFFDPALIAACGYFIRSKHSRVAAVLGLIYGPTTVFGTLMVSYAMRIVGAGSNIVLSISNIVLSIILTVAGVRGVQATFALQGRFKAAPNVPENT